MNNGPRDITYREFALEILNKTHKESIPQVAARVFGVSEVYAKRKAWEWMKHDAYVAEVKRIEGERSSGLPATKEDKLLKNKILMDEAYSNRDSEVYIKLARIDNDMQGHTKGAETEDEKVQGQNALIGTLIEQLREKNKSALKVANQEIIDV